MRTLILCHGYSRLLYSSATSRLSYLGIYALKRIHSALAVLGMPLVPPQAGFSSLVELAADDPDARLLYNAIIAVIHEATLQELLRYGNDTVHRLLLERNTLLEER